MQGIFPESKTLKEIIEQHKWTLYDVSQSDQVLDQYQVMGTYLFAPKLKQGQTLTDVAVELYSSTPSLKIEDPNDKRWLSLSVSPKRVEDAGQYGLIFFYTISFGEECAFVTTPERPGMPEPDWVAISYDHLVDTFRKYFKIIHANVPTNVPSAPGIQ